MRLNLMFPFRSLRKAYLPALNLVMKIIFLERIIAGMRESFGGHKVYKK